MRRIGAPTRPLALRLGALLTALAVGAAPLSATAQVQNYTCSAPGGFAPVELAPAPAEMMASLKTIPNPVLPRDPVTGALTLRADLADYIANVPAAIQLGKALFWDVQAGSDKKTACASCHFRAGADGRSRHQLHPGANGVLERSAANTALTGAKFPISPQFDDVAGSQGVRSSSYVSVNRNGVESVLETTPGDVRQVTSKNAPSVINAVFNHRQFWNGRAQPEFNGVNPFGTRDTSARVWVLDFKGLPAQTYISIPDASLASQAVGPALSTVEMSAAGRTFPDLGRKMLRVVPLAQQQVAPTDSVLGPLATATTGLTATYAGLIEQAFQPRWWNSTRNVAVNGINYSMKEANFSLFWGLALMLYEATLVSDDSPMDRYLASRVFDPATGTLLSHDPSVLDTVVGRLAGEGIVVSRNSILAGLELFERPVAPAPSFPVKPGFGAGCVACHLGAETTSASMRNLKGRGNEPGHVVFATNGFDPRMERMFARADWTPPGPLSTVPQGATAISFNSGTYKTDVTALNGVAVAPINLPVVTYDSGWYNVGVRPTSDDLGLGGLLDATQAADPLQRPLSWVRLFQGLSDPSFVRIPGNGLPCDSAGNINFPGELLNAAGFPLLSGPLTRTEPTGVDGTFKVPSLRNVEFTGPYFHNGGKATLWQAMTLYNVGGDFRNATKAPALVPLMLNFDQQSSLIAFLLAMSDERVRREQAPFDHPSLPVPAGQNARGVDLVTTLPAVGAGGATPIPRFLGLNPFSP